MQAGNATLVYVGTQTQSNAKGIYVFRLRTEGNDVSQNITLVPMGLAVETQNPTFLELDLKRRILYAVNSVNTFGGKPGGAVSAFSIADDTGKLTLLNQQPSMGAAPCHLTLDAQGKYVLVANYGGGNLSVLPVLGDGRLGEAVCVVQHSGKSIDSERQSAPHAHCVTPDPANRFVFVCDLGLDKVMSYRFDAQSGKLTPADPAFTACKPGSGPRHMAFRPDGRFAYVVSEMSSTLTGFAYDAQTGRLKEIETVSTLPPYFDGKNAAAELGIHPSGKWLYVSNRGNETVVLFEIDKDLGTLKYIEEQGTGGKTPRHFGIQPSAAHLAIGNQDSDTVLVCRIDSGNGRLKPSGVFAQVPSPVCIRFLPPPKGV
jgi:6-phosphogluconolactonase